MKRPRRNHTAAYKAKVALAALKGDKTLAELSEKFDVHASQIVQWKAQLLDGAMGVFLTMRAMSAVRKWCSPRLGGQSVARGRSPVRRAKSRSRFGRIRGVKDRFQTWMHTSQAIYNLFRPVEILSSALQRPILWRAGCHVA